jgi:hypothetical protein
MDRHELKQISPGMLREIENPSGENMDDVNLARIGKRAVLRVSQPLIGS